MRKYEEKKENQVVEVYCNCCGKKLAVKDGVIMEGVLPVTAFWGYFSEKTENVTPLIYAKAVLINGLQGFKFRWKRK